ncbi:uncharacterized protein AB675_1923 [Cyphellophora attinorum]|uniref:AB hydrolase-1 domain-containing protein n=1 Tax=Cyphellophora attinorum TaxID=1664694 RepID=A0A0N1P115_9EURO|nr:uncharacterized protein AB675_1923 [Phialophora attinorum]KPI42965.1 hypothetical protein AB675_1923 [Phialophora attinorum]
MNGSLSNKKPVILLVTGAWHAPEHYAPLIALLRSYGYTVHCPLLPSNSQSQPPANLDDDILFIRPYALSLLSATDLVVLTHSYGGMVASYALANLTQISPNRLTHLIYMTAFLPLPGESLCSIFGMVPPFLRPNPSTNNIGFIPNGPRIHFYQDCHPSQIDRAPGNAEKVYEALFAASDLPLAEAISQAQADAKRQLAADPAAIIANPALADLQMAYDDPNVEVAYIHCTQDAGLLPQLQEMMIGRVHDRWAQKASRKVAKGASAVIREERIEAGHSPFLSRVDETARVVDCIIMGD